MSERRKLGAAIAALGGGAAWGAFWVPVRALEHNGFADLWGVAALWGGVALLAVPMLVWRRRQLRAGGLRLQATGVLLGAAVAFYSAAFLYTDVASAVLLYYLSPVWGFVLAWLVLKDPITPVRWLAMLLALGGAAVLLGAQAWPPLPANQGDWLAIGAGLLFVVGSLMMLTRPSVSSVDYVGSFFLWAGVLSVVAALATSGTAPSAGAWAATAWWLAAAIVLLAGPGSFAALYGASVLNPGVVGILFMTEIGVSLILAAMLTEEPFGLREAAGLALISTACVAEGVVHLVRARRLAV